MRPLLTILVFLTPFIGFAQNWNLINAERQLHYSIDTTVWYDATVLVDSISTNGADSIFHLNRIVTECDSCPNDWQFHYLRYNQPTFMQRVAVKNGDSWNLRSPNSFTILPHAELNQIWLFDTLNTVTAVVTAAMDATVLGVSDSIKTISLSSGDSIMISKNFGIIDMGNQSNRWHLMGAELPDTVHGFKLPGFDEIYDFQIGDVFESYGRTNYAGSCGEGWTRRTVLARSNYSDSIVYEMQVQTVGKGCSSPMSQALFDSEISEVTYAQGGDNIIELTNSSLMFEEVWSETIFQQENHLRSRITLDSLNRPSKTEGNGYDEHWSNSPAFFKIDSGNVNILVTPYDNSDENHYYRRSFGVGLGRTFIGFQKFEYSRIGELRGFIKGLDTVGILLGSDFFTTSVNDQFNSQFSLWPNPASEAVKGKFGLSVNVLSMEIIGIEGKTYSTDWTSNSESFEVDVSTLKPGLYLLRVITENGTSVSRFIKQ